MKVADGGRMDGRQGLHIENEAHAASLIGTAEFNPSLILSLQFCEPCLVFHAESDGFVRKPSMSTCERSVNPSEAELDRDSQRPTNNAGCVPLLACWLAELTSVILGSI